MNFNLLSERLKWAIAEKSQRENRRIFQAELANVAGVSRAAVTNWMKDENGIDALQARALAEFFNVNAVWLETGNGKPDTNVSAQNKNRSQMINTDETDDFVAIKRVDFKLSAGVTGFSIEYLNGDRAPIFFRKDWLDKRGYKAEKLHALPISGQSMETSMFEGDLVVINVDDTQPIDGEVFAANYEGELVIKRMVRESGNWYLASDNPDKRRFPNKICHEECFIIGRVVYKQSERI